MKNILRKIKKFRKKPVFNLKKYILAGGLILLAILAFAKFENYQKITRLSLVEDFFADPLMVKEKMEKNDQSLLVVDIRSREKYVEGHLQTAVNIEASRKDFEKEVKKIARGKKLLVVYGDFSLSPEPMKAAIRLFKSGLRPKILAIGWKEWQLYFTRFYYDPAHPGAYPAPVPVAPEPGFAN